MIKTLKWIGVVLVGFNGFAYSIIAFTWVADKLH